MKKEAGKDKKPFPWLLLILLLASLYAFWVLPFQLGPRPVEVEFERIPQAAPKDSP